VVTKKTVFKWQEGFWQRLKDVFDKDYLCAHCCRPALPPG
jgi:hypothetical protein